MHRTDYRVYSPARIGDLTLPTRWVRSATADLAPWKPGRFTEDDVELYRIAATSGIGLLIVNGPDIVPPSYAQGTALTSVGYSYDDVRIEGTAELLAGIRAAAPDVAILAQIGCNELVSSEIPAGPSPVTSPYYEGRFRELAADEIRWIIDALVHTAVHMKAEGRRRAASRRTRRRAVDVPFSPFKPAFRRVRRIGGEPCPGCSRDRDGRAARAARIPRFDQGELHGLPRRRNRRNELRGPRPSPGGCWNRSH